MKIWIINQYASLPTTGMGGRHRHLARELAARGHRVSVIAARGTHLTRDMAAERTAPQFEEFEGFRFVRVDLPAYRHAHDWRRMRNWGLFAWRILQLEELLAERPDVVLYSSPSLIGYLAAERLARRHGAPLVFEVRDIWPLTLTLVGNRSPHHPFVRVLQWIEDRAYRNADHVISNLPGAGDHMASRAADAGKFSWIPNGISVQEMQSPSAADCAAGLAKPPGKFRVGYTGTIGVANALDTAVEAANRLRDLADVEFVFVGDGNERGRLIARAQALGLRNVIFAGAVPKEAVQSVVSTFDVCLITWKRSRLYDHGIAANKLFDYFYAARPVLHAYSGRYDPVAEYDAGITVPAEDPDALAEAVLRMKSMSVEVRDRMGANGHRAVLNNHEYSQIAERLERILVSRVAAQ